MPYHVSIRELHVNGRTYHSSSMDRVKNAKAGNLILICTYTTMLASQNRMPGWSTPLLSQHLHCITS